MYRLKVFLGTIVLLLLLVVLTASSFKKDSKRIIGSSNTSKISLESKWEVQQYNFQKEALTKALKAYFKKAISSGDIIGAGVSIVKGDSILISEGYGKRNIDENETVDGETVFRLGSISKGFTGVLMAELKNEGKIDWNDRVTDYIPDFHFGDTRNTDKVKLAHILSHTAGTPYHSFTNLVEAGLPMDKIAKRFIEVNPISVPGKQYSYQNAMFALSQEVMLKVTGNTIQELLTNHFFKPLNMYSVSMDYKSLSSSDNVALPHRKVKNKWRKLNLTNRYDNAVAAGGVNASSQDMAKWMRFLLGHNPKVMQSEAINEIFEPFITFRNTNKYYQRWPGHVDSSYGFGWRIHTFQNKDLGNLETIWHHGGSVNNYRNEIALYPESDLGICVLINSNSKIAKAIIPELRSIITSIYTKPMVKVAKI